MKLVAIFLSLLLPIAVRSETPKLPFVFLNQYFEYDVSEGKIFSIGDRKIDWNDDFAQIINGKLILKKQEIFMGGLWNVSLKDKANKVVFNLKEQDLNSVRNFALPTARGSKKTTALNATTVCLNSRNVITQYLICKSLVPVAATSDDAKYPEVLIAKKKVNKFGRVILNQPKKSILFEVKLNNVESIKLTTRKRLIIPSTVKNNVVRKEYQIRFVDAEWDNYFWDANVNFEQEAFRIPNDNLVTVYQDYFNKDNSNKELDVTYYVPPYKRMRIMSMYSFSPYFGFSEFQGNTRTKNVLILSEMDISFRTYIMMQASKEEKWKWFTQYFHFWTASANFRAIKYVSEVNSFTIANPSGFLFNFSGSINRSFNERISYALRGAVEKNTAVDYTSSASSIVNMNYVLNKEIGVQGSLNLYDRGRFVSYLHAGYSLLLPTQISGVQSAMGSRTYFRTELHYSEGNKLYGVGFHYNLRNQQTALQKLKDQSFDYTASYSVAF